MGAEYFKPLSRRRDESDRHRGTESVLSRNHRVYLLQVERNIEDTAGFSKAHCRPEDAVNAEAHFEHSAVAGDTTTKLRWTNKRVGPNTESTSVTKCKSVRAGVEVELQASGVEAAEETEAFPNHMFNRAAASGEMFIEGTGRIKFTGVKVTTPAGKGCIVAGEAITTRLLTASSASLAAQLKYAPSGTEPFTTFLVPSCSIAGLNGSYEVTGSVKGAISGATNIFTHPGTTEQATLKVGGQNAGIEGELTFEGKAPADLAWHPMSVT